MSHSVAVERLARVARIYENRCDSKFMDTTGIIPSPGQVLVFDPIHSNRWDSGVAKLRRKMIRSACPKFSTHQPELRSKPQVGRPPDQMPGSTPSGGFFPAGLFCRADGSHVFAAFRVQRTDHFPGKEENLLRVFFLSHQGGKFPPAAGRFHIPLRHENLSSWVDLSSLMIDPGRSMRDEKLGQRSMACAGRVVT